MLNLPGQRQPESDDTEKQTKKSDERDVLVGFVNLAREISKQTSLQRDGDSGNQSDVKRIVGKSASSPSSILKTRPKIAGKRKQHRARDSHRNAVVNICAGVTHLRRQIGNNSVAPIVGAREAIPRQRCSQSEHRHRGWVPDRHEKFFFKFQSRAPNGRRPAMSSAIGRVAGIR